MLQQEKGTCVCFFFLFHVTRRLHATKKRNIVAKKNQKNNKCVLFFLLPCSKFCIVANVHGKKKKRLHYRKCTQKMKNLFFALKQGKQILLLCFSHITSSHCIAFLLFFSFVKQDCIVTFFFFATRKKKSLSVVASACSKKTHVARRKKRACIAVFFSMEQACVESNVIG